MANTDVVRRMFEAYLAQDDHSADRLLADDFVFTSPQDDHIDKAAFMETGERHRNIELITMRDGKLWRLRCSSVDGRGEQSSPVTR
jgi:hypothetical protein